MDELKFCEENVIRLFHAFSGLQSVGLATEGICSSSWCSGWSLSLRFCPTYNTPTNFEASSESAFSWILVWAIWGSVIEYVFLSSAKLHLHSTS